MTMIDTSMKKVKSQMSPRGAMGQKYLVAGIRLSMRLWEDLPAGDPGPSTSREYETIGYVIKGRAELRMEGQTILLDEGDAWLVPMGAKHSYHILETFTAIEATAPPAEMHARDEHQ
jgi:quercetin dioxygenase-like cupin family protein